MLNLTFFTNEAWFHLSVYLNSQNYLTWPTFVETTLHPLKRSCRNILGQFFEHEIQFGHFQQDNTYTTRKQTNVFKSSKMKEQ